VAAADDAAHKKAAAEKAQREKDAAAEAEANETEEEKELQALFDYFTAKRKAEMTPEEIKEEREAQEAWNLADLIEQSVYLRSQAELFNTWGGLCVLFCFVWFDCMI
jgi:hypothetical protein